MFVNLCSKPYLLEERIFGFLVVSICVLLLYSVYRLVILKMSERIRTVFNGLLSIAVIFIFVLFFSEITITLIMQHQVNRQLGFNYATPQTPEGELFLITRIVPGKTMDRAGLMRYDQVQMWSVPKFYKLLADNQGKEVEFTVIRGSKKMIIRVKVPMMDLFLRRFSFLI